MGSITKSLQHLWQRSDICWHEGGSVTENHIMLKKQVGHCLGTCFVSSSKKGILDLIIFGLFQGFRDLGVCILFRRSAGGNNGRLFMRSCVCVCGGGGASIRLLGFREQGAGI